ncbi:MAG: LysM peptidoglycan-binding domain-containing protein [Weeksellaceae bacterium]
MKNIFGIMFLLLLSGMLSAQQKTHKVEAQETVYGISKQYGISQEDLINANPFLKDRMLQIGDELVIPDKSGKNGDGNIKPKADGNINAVVTTVDESAPTVNVPKEDSNFIYLEIKPKQTIYSLTKEYNISEEALRSLNPQLKDGLKAGDVIRIPRKSNQNKEEEITPAGMYKVKKGDTVYSLSRQFNVSSDEFYISNPDIQTSGLVVDTYINIPKKGKISAVIQDGFIEHKVKQGETIYSITKLYRVTFADLLKYNPELSDGLRAGMTLKIPLPEGAEILNAGKIKRVDDSTISIALILPFHLDDPQARSTEKDISADILIGAKIALDSLAYTGKKINLKVYDSGNSSQSVENLIVNNDFSQFDAVVGPIFGSNFKTAATMLTGSGITVVSPLSNSEDLRELENVVVVTPSDEDIADAIVNEIAANYKGQQIQILTDDRYQGLADYFSNHLKKKLPTAEIIVTKNISQLEQTSKTVDEKLSDGTVVAKTISDPLIAVLVSDNNSLGDKFVDKLKKMDTDNLSGYGVKFVNAYDIYSEKNKSNISALKNIGFTFSTNRLVNVYGKNERTAIQKFLDLYCEIPNEYRQLGFDTLYDLVDRMNTRGDVLNNMGSEKTRLSTKFKYVKTGKAFVNTGVRVIRLFTEADESPDDVDQ